MKVLSAAAVCALFLGLLAPAGRAQGLKGVRQDFAGIGESAIPATVIVRAPEAPPQAGSTGVIVHEDGYVLSDADATLVRVEPKEGGGVVKHHGVDAVIRLPAPDHRVLRAIVVRRDEETDTTLLRIVDPPKGLPVIRTGVSDPLRVGSFLLAVGNAFGLGAESEPALSMGVAAALTGRTERSGGRYQTIYTTAAVNPGSNGGPVVDLSGRVVGIISTYETDATSPFRALGKITPIDLVRSRYEGVEGFEKAFPPPDETPRPPRDAGALEEAIAIVARHVYPSLASLQVDRGDAETTIPILDPRGSPVMGPDGKPLVIQRYPGPYSAVVLSRDGYLLTCTTNLWAFDRIRSVTAHFPNGRTLPARVVARDRYRYIALLKVEAEDLVPLPRANEKDLRVGRFALAFANPFGAARQAAPLFTFGIVSDLHRNVAPDFDAIQTDAAMNDGIVGGALVTLEGKLLGVNILVNQDRFGRNSGIGFAIPMSGIDRSLPRLRQGKDVEPGFLGIGTPVQGPDGIVFTGVAEDGPAGKAGLKAGDVLLEADRRPATVFADPGEFIAYVRSKEPGQALVLKVRRGTAEVDLSIVLGSRPGD